MDQPKRIAFAAIVDGWIDRLTLTTSKANALTARTAFNQFQRATEITWLDELPDAIQRHQLNRLRQGRSRATVNKDCRYLRQLAKFHGLTVKTAQLREPVKAPRTRPTPDITATIKAAPSEWWAILLLTAYATALRADSLLSIGPVGSTSEIIVRLDDEKQNKARRLPIPDGLAARIRTVQDGNHAFPWQYSRSWFWRTLKRWQVEAGLAPLTMHDLRRSAVTHLLSDGTSLAIVQRFGGWASPAILMKHYADDLREARAAVAVSLFERAIPKHGDEECLNSESDPTARASLSGQRTFAW